MAKLPGVYEIVNTANGKRYIGSAVHMPDRFSSHRGQLIRGTHDNRHLQRSWAKDGAEAFVFRPLLICAIPQLLLYEQLCIDGLQPEYNIARVAGSTLGVKIAPDACARMSESRRGKKRGPMSPTHRVNHASAQKARKRPPPFTAEHRTRLSEIGKGRPKAARSEEHKANLSRSRKGKYCGYRPPEVGIAISEALRRKGIKPSAECLERSAAARRGKGLAPEVIAKIVAANTGKKRGPYKKHSAEANALKSERQRQRYAALRHG